MFSTIKRIKVKIDKIFKKKPAPVTLNLNSLYSHRLNYLYICMVAKFITIDHPATAREILAFKSTYALVPKNIKVNEILQEAFFEDFDSIYFAKKIKSIIPDDTEILKYMMISLIMVAWADEFINKTEMKMLKQIASIFGISYLRLLELTKDTFLKAEDCPYLSLGANQSMSFEAITNHYKNLAKTLHPDVLLGNRNIDYDFKDIIIERFNQIQSAYSFIKSEYKHKV